MVFLSIGLSIGFWSVMVTPHRSLIPQEAGHDAPHFCTDPLMATLAHFDTDQAR